MLLKLILFYLGNLPPPTTPEEVGARILQMERFVRGEAPVRMGTKSTIESFVLTQLIDLFF